MDVDVIQKIKKLYRIQHAFEKYNILNQEAFRNDDCFQYILHNYNIENNFEKQFCEKYTHEVTQSKKYKETQKNYETQQNQDNKEMQQNQDNEEIQLNQDNEEIQQNQELSEDEIQFDNTPKKKKPNIKEVDKIMYKKIALISHPDKTKSNEKVVVFKKANDYMKSNWSIGLVHCCSLLKIKTNFIYVDDEMSDHFFQQMRTVIEEIIQLYNLRNNRL